MKAAMNLFFSMAGVVLLAGCGSGDVPSPESHSPNGHPEAADKAGVAPVTPQEFVGSEAAVPGGYCALDAINGGDARSASAKVGTEVWFSGWLAGDDKQVPADAQFVFLGEQGSYSIPATTGVARPDVARALGSEALSTSGYNILADLEIAPGIYRLAVVLDDGDRRRCDLDSRLMVVE